ncbi:MAG: DUF1887 family protein [Oscillospiraceae bacterium]|jgi:hypothetical protein|nr:DUF1887 family protein [Oscillospiraceae bacterium]
MTLVEIYDRSAFKNLYASLAWKPERLIVLYDKRRQKQQAENEEIKRFLQNDSPGTVFLGFAAVPQYSLHAVKKVCEALYEKYPDLAFDLTGGREILLFGALAFCEEKGVPCFYVDLQGREFVPVSHCEALPPFSFFDVSIKTMLLMEGAAVRRSLRSEFDAHSKEQGRQLEDVTRIAKTSGADWSSFAFFMQAACKNITGETPDAAEEDESLRYRTATQLTHAGRNVRLEASVFERMVQKGLIAVHEQTAKLVEFSFADLFIKKICKDKGAWLEYYTYFLADKACLFDELSLSTVIDWIERKKEPDDPVNEIDVILRKGFQNIYVSCKTGTVESAHLFEIQYLAERFGGDLSRAVIVTSTAVTNANILKRLREMNIALIDKKDLEEPRFIAKLKEIAAGQC